MNEIQTIFHVLFKDYMERDEMSLQQHETVETVRVSASVCVQWHVWRSKTFYLQYEDACGIFK